ncbi:MAG: hypothetical protein WAK98_03430, partial [Gemmobacter sp.]
MIEGNFNSVQSLLWPEPGISTERELYMRLSGPVAHSLTGRNLTFSAGGQAAFDTSANLFNLGKWRRHCGETDLVLRLEGEGRFELVVMQALTEQTCECLFSEAVDVAVDNPFRLDLTPHLLTGNRGVVYFSVQALSAGRLTGAGWETTAAPRRLPQLALSITTFKREVAVQASVAQFEDFMARTALA